MAKTITDLETWLLDEGDKLYRFLVYKRLFTPYEQNHAFMDESIYEDYHYSLCRIEQAIDLSDGEWLLGLRKVDELTGEDVDIIEYYRLSEIRLARFDKDNDARSDREQEAEDDTDEL
ncbi:MAG: hypothetical protein IKA41_08685 [Bacteroidaceae bacterium]|nr:hypothetical protein [Bacteroidaceae bacterium]